LLPTLDNPRILDVGCGTGIPTMALADLTQGEIVAIDIDLQAIRHLQKKILQRGLSSRVEAIHCSLEELSSPPESFEIIWEEGVIHMLDLEEFLTITKRLLKSGGFLVINETITWLERHRVQFLHKGFDFWTQFLLPKNSWWTEYYAVLEKRVEELRCAKNFTQDITKLQRYADEIALVKPDPGKYDCGFYVLR